MIKQILFTILLSSQVKAVETSVASMEVMGKAKFGGLMQTWYVDDWTTGTEVHQNFKIRRVELKFSGSVAEKTKWFALVDMAKAIDTSASSKDSKFLQDLGVSFIPFANFEFTIGQMRIPNNWETARSSGDLLLPERSLVTRTFGDRRDLGAMVSYTFLENAKFNFMVSNGVNADGKSTNVDETNSTKDINGRFEYEFFRDTKVGAYGGSQVAGNQGATKNKSLWGLDFQYATDPWFVALDYMQARESTNDDLGYVVTVGYKFLPKFQIVMRYDYLDVLVSPEVVSQIFATSLNYLIAGTNSEIQFGFANLRNAKGSGGSYTSAANQSGEVAVLAFLAKF